MKKRSGLVFVYTTKSLVLFLVAFVLGTIIADAADCYTHNSAGGKGFATPQLACEHAVFQYQRNKYARVEPVKTDRGPSDDWRCYAKQSANDNNKNDDYDLTLVTPMPIEPHCYTEVCGPYGNIPDPPGVGRGKEFDYKTQVSKVRYQSDRKFRGLPVEPFPPSWKLLQENLKMKFLTSDIFNVQNLISGQSYYESYVKLSPRGDDLDSVEAHHIIPRVDSNGCPCGTNSFKNILLVSKRMNGLFGIHARSQNLLAHVASISACN